MAAAFSIRGYAESLRGTAAADLGPFGFAAKDLPPMEVRVFRWWEDELAAVKAAEADEDEEVALAPGKGRAPKKRSISDLFAAAPPVDASDSGNAAEEDEEEALCAIMRRMKRKRRSQAAAAAAAAAAETTRAEQLQPAANFAREKALDKSNLRDDLDTPEASNEPEDEHPLGTEKEKTPDLKGRKYGKTNSSQKKKADRLKYIESRKAIKVGKQRDTKKAPPLNSILKKYTKHTSVKMVKEKHCNSKGSGVIELCRKSVKCVKFSEANDALVSKKQCSKIPQLESLCKMISDVMTSSSSTDMSSEGDRHIVAESSSSHKPEKAFTNAKEVNENITHANYCELSNTGLSTGLFDLNQEAFPESPDVNAPHIPNSEVSYLEHTQDRNISSHQQVLDNGRENQRDLFFDPHGQEYQLHDTDLDTRTKGKLPFALPNRTVRDSVLQQNWCSMTLHQGVSQLSTGGKPPSCKCRECNLPHSEKTNFHSEMNVQQESSPAAEQTVRLMGKDLTVSKTRVDYFAETAQNYTGSSTKENLTTNLVLELPRQGQPFLSLQAQSNPIVSTNSATTAHVSANSASTGTAHAHFGYRSPHNFSHPLSTANVFSSDPSPYEDRFRDLPNLQSHRNVVLGCPPLPKHASSAAFLQNSLTPWRYYSDHSARTESPSFLEGRTQSPSASFFTTITRHVTPYSDYRASLPQPYGVNSASSSVHPHNFASFTWSHPDQIIQGISDSRASAAVPYRNADSGTTRAVPDNSNTSSSSRYVVRSGPVKLSAGAKHILMPSENTEDENSAPVYSCVSFGSSHGNVSAPQKKGADFRKF